MILLLGLQSWPLENVHRLNIFIHYLLFMAFYEWISILILHCDGNLHLRWFMLPFDVNQNVQNASLVWIFTKETRRHIGEIEVWGGRWCWFKGLLDNQIMRWIGKMMIWGQWCQRSLLDWMIEGFSTSGERSSSNSKGSSKEWISSSISVPKNGLGIGSTTKA